MINLLFDKLVVDEREPLLSFEYLDHHARIYFPNVQFYVQAFFVGLWLQILVNCVLCTIIYYGIVRVKNYQPKTSSTQGLLVGFGIVIPLASLVPYYIIDMLDIRSKVLRMSLVGTPMTMSLTSLEAMCGFTPTPCISSLTKFILSEAMMARPVLENGQHIPATFQRYIKSMGWYVIWILLLSILISLLDPWNFSLFPTPKPASEIMFSFHPSHLYNTFFQAVTMNLFLQYSFYGAATTVSQATGLQYDEDSTIHPMFASTSPSDFWGRRWNLMIHKGLKQGVYKPVRWNTGNKHLAYFSAFLVSGILHELVWSILFYINSTELAEGDACRTCYHVSYGKQILFFGWNGILLILESLIGDRLVFLKRFLPQIMICHLVVLLSLPVGHLFTDDIVHGGFFKHLGIALFKIQVDKIR